MPAPESAASPQCARCGRPSKAELCARCHVDDRIAELLKRIEADRGSVTDTEREITDKMAKSEAIVDKLKERFEADASPSQKLADAVARVGGSWAFVGGALAVIACWFVLNTLLLRDRAFDPYPYILLNFVLSCVAALQAPIILMSQNRAAARDRLESEEDFRVNLRAELEIATLHAKLDALMQPRWGELLELQQLQIDLLRGLDERTTAETPARAPRAGRSD